MTTSRLLALAATLLLAGCGTLVGLAGDREVRVITNPPGARLLVDGIPVEGPSPNVVLLDPAEEHRVDARLDDLRGGTQIKRSASTGLVIADVVFTLGLGLWIDWMTGALYDFPEAVVVNLGRAHPPEPPLAAQFPPPPALMPHRDPVAPPPPPPTPAKQTRVTNLLACEVCNEGVTEGEPCAACGQPPR